MDLLTDLVGEDWWQDVALSMLETMRRTIRGLVRLIPAKHRGVIYSDFEDELGELTHAELKGLEIGTDRGRTLSPAEYAFVDLLIESLTQNGYLDVGELYEPPFKRVGDPDVVFRDASDVDVIVDVLDHVKKTAVPVTDAEAC